MFRSQLRRPSPRFSIRNLLVATLLLALSVPVPGADADEGIGWEPAGPAGIPAILAVAADPVDGGTLHLATTDGVYTTRNAGGTWVLTPIPGLRTVAVHPEDPNRLYGVALDDSRVRVWRSSDRGASWRQVGESELDGFEEPVDVDFRTLLLAPNDPDALFVGLGLAIQSDLGSRNPPDGEVLRSLDGGHTLAPLGAPPVAHDVPRDLLLMPDGRLLAATFDGVWAAPAALAASELDWEPSLEGLAQPSDAFPPVVRLAPHATDPGVVYAGTGDLFGDLVYRSTDGGASWAPVAGPPEKATGLGAVEELVVHPRDGRTLFATVEDPPGSRRVFASRDGATFEALEPALPDRPPELDRGRATANLALAATSPVTVYAAVGGELLRRVPPPPPCTEGPLTACLHDRFRVDLAWRTAAGDRGAGTVEPLPGDGSWFWFFHRDNPELLFKVLDGRAVNDHWWVFFTGLTDVAFDLRVIDTLDGRTRVYANPQGRFVSRAATDAFPARAVPEEVAQQPLWFAALPQGGCGSDSADLCLHDGRFRVEVEWRLGEESGKAVGDGLTPRAGWFWFFRPGNPELLVKVLDGRPVNGHWWVFFGSLTDVAYTLTVTDTLSDESRSYESAAGALTSRGDVAAFEG